MKKTVLKKSDVLQSLRPIIIQPLEKSPDESVSQNTNTLPYIDNLQELDSHTESYATENTENMVLNSPDNSENTVLSHEVPEKLTQDAHNKATAIIESAHQEADDIIKKANESRENILAEAKTQAENIQSTMDQEVLQATTQAKQEGLQQGLQEAQTETKRLVTLLQKVSVDLVDEKVKILDTIESDIVDLILMISSKVVKSITTQYKQVVVDNVLAAIKKLKIHNNILVKVNPDDLYTIQEYKSEILAQINGIENIQILEDPSIELGGCIIQSEFGSVDGRISSQLAEIEEQIRKISPIKPI